MLKHWMQAARLRTLPLSVSGIILGTFYAMSQSYFNWNIFFLAIATTLGLQILSNFANDYGDGVKGTDNEDRIGPKRAIQSGVISAVQMKKAVYLTAIITLVLAVLLIYFSFKKDFLLYSLFFFVLGIFAVFAAVKYTVGKSAYGYRGLGDVFVFLFFGWVSTMGTYFLYSKTWDWQLLVPATAIGFLSAAVLNLNNMRDEVSDRKSNKNTLVVKIGGKLAKKYHFFLVVSAIVLMLVFGILQKFAWDQYIYVIVFLPLISHLIRVYKTDEPKNLDPELKKLALSTFFVALLLSLCLIFFISDLVV
jgi:1,4-dihydroxy-2-naphthoate polyprenyltransferase